MKTDLDVQYSNDKPQPIRLVLVEDQKMIAESLSDSIKLRAKDIVVVTDIYYDLQSCRKSLEINLPDVLLLDIDLPDGNGIDFCSEVTAKYPEIKVIMLTVFNDINFVRHALSNGAFGYILKDTLLKELLDGIQKVNRGEQFLCKALEHLEHYFLFDDDMSPGDLWDDFLSDTEKIVLLYHIADLPRKEIAIKLERSDETIKTHLRNISTKIKAKAEKAFELLSKYFAGIPINDEIGNSAKTFKISIATLLTKYLAWYLTREEVAIKLGCDTVFLKKYLKEGIEGVEGLTRAKISAELCCSEDTINVYLTALLNKYIEDETIRNELAKILGLGEKTVKSHLRNIIVQINTKEPANKRIWSLFSRS